MEYTTYAQKLITMLENKITPTFFERLMKELQGEWDAGKTNDLINAGDVIRAGAAVGLNVELIEKEYNA